MENIDLTMLARSTYRAILRNQKEAAKAEAKPETVKEVVPMAAKK